MKIKINRNYFLDGEFAAVRLHLNHQMTKLTGKVSGLRQTTNRSPRQAGQPVTLSAEAGENKTANSNSFLTFYGM